MTKTAAEAMLPARPVSSVDPRRRIFTTVLALCHDVERLEISEEGRLACREVRSVLRHALGKDIAPIGRR